MSNSSKFNITLVPLVQQLNQGASRHFCNLLRRGDEENSDENGADRMHTEWRHHWPMQLLIPRLLRRGKEIVDGSHIFPSYCYSIQTIKGNKIISCSLYININHLQLQQNAVYYLCTY